MNCHLVAIEIGIEGDAYERVNFDSLPLYQNRLERLNSQAVQGGSSVK